MTEPAERTRPYAAPSNVISVFSRVRTRNLPEKIDSDFLRIAGIPDTVFGRVMAALRFLDMIDDGGRPTDTLRSLAAAPDEEYRTILDGALRSAYAEDFGRVHPGEDTQARIVDAFMPYQPRSQTSRMVMLFLGLCREAGIPVLDAPRDRPMRASGSRPAAMRSGQRTPARKGTSVARGGSGRSAGESAAPSSPGLLFGVTEADIGALPEDEFQEVWAALGKVARARARRQTEEDAKLSPEEENDD